MNFNKQLALQGKSDEEKLINLQKILESFGILKKHIYKDHYIIFRNSDYKIVKFGKEITNNDMILYKNDIIHHPDFIISNDNKDIQYIIELDGSIHHTKPGLKKTERRNKDYQYAEIPYLILDEVYLEKMNISIEEYLYSNLPELYK